MKNRARLRYDLLLALWPLAKYAHWLSKLPFLGPLLVGKTNTATNQAILLPRAPARSISIDHRMAGTESVALPYPLLDPVLERASARTVLNECPCRRAERCAGYPRDLGCLFLGDGAAQIDASLGREATPEQAQDHIRRAMAAGLMPTVLHSSFDAYLLDIPYRRMLAICFCCDCCCTVRHSLTMGVPGFADTVVRLPGLSVEIGTSCTGCGTCLSVCPVGAISLAPSPQPGQAQIDLERCKGCGRCVSTCPSNAIRLHLYDQVEMLERLLDRIAQRTDIGATIPTDRNLGTGTQS